MRLTLKILTISIFLWFLASTFNAQSQTFSIDTTSFLNPDDSFEGPEGFDYEESSAAVSNEMVTKDMMFVPTNVLYKNRWDTLNIRIGRTDWSKISDSAILFSNDLSVSNFVFPFKGKVISPYGYRGGHFHAGMDIKLNKGDTVVSAFDGTVRIARVISGYGKIIVIRHDNGIETVYGHLSAYLVKVNDKVIAGQPIGLGGRTGRATTEHLHFETRILGEHFNPALIIDFDSFCLKPNCSSLDKNLLGFGSKDTPMVVDNNHEPNNKFVKVRSGDTLYAIALKHKTTVDRICKMNGITPKKVLRVGTKLRVG